MEQIQILMKVTTIYSENWYFCSESNKIIAISIGTFPSGNIFVNC